MFGVQDEKLANSYKFNFFYLKYIKIHKRHLEKYVFYN